MIVNVITHWNTTLDKSVEEYVDMYLDFKDAVECANDSLVEWMDVDIVIEEQIVDTKVSGLRFTEVHGIRDGEVIAINYVREQEIY